MPRIILVVIAVAIFATVAVAGFQAGLENAGEDELVINETWTPDAGNVTALDNSNLQGAYYDETVSVYDENHTKMVEGTDYEWFTDNGTVKALVGGDLEGDTEATISYSYQATTAEQRNMAQLLSHVPRVMGLALPVGALFVLLLFVRGM